MVNTFDEIIRAALALPPNSRAMLAEHLLRSLDGEDQSLIVSDAQSLSNLAFEALWGILWLTYKQFPNR